MTPPLNGWGCSDAKLLTRYWSVSPLHTFVFPRGIPMSVKKGCVTARVMSAPMSWDECLTRISQVYTLA